MKYLLSIVIPTKNRYKYLKICLRSLKILDKNKVEIIIQDNSENNQYFYDYIYNNLQDNFNYYYNKQILSQTENSNLAVLHANGEYICYIGDDDSVTNQIIEITEWLQMHRIEAASFNCASYAWPDLKFRIFKFPDLIVYDRNTINNHFQIIDALISLNEALKNGGVFKLLPCVYHGIVKKSTLDIIFLKCGSYFPGASPDMANATALSLVTKSYVYINLPIIISGTCYNSAGGMGARGQHKALLKNVKQLPQGIEENWISEIPKIWTGETIWAHSCIESIINMKANAILSYFNYAKLYARIFVMHPDLYIYIKPCIIQKKILFNTVIYIMQIFIARIIRFISNFFLIKLKISKHHVYNNVCNVHMAANVVSNYIDENNLLDFIKEDTNV